MLLGMAKKAEYVIVYLSEVAMAQMNDIEQDVLELLEKLGQLSQSEKKEALMSLFKKHLIINQGELHLSYDDFQEVVGNAKMLYSQIPFPVKMQDNRNFQKELATSEVGNYCVIESMISLLNKKEALKKLPVFKKGR